MLLLLDVRIDGAKPRAVDGDATSISGVLVLIPLSCPWRIGWVVGRGVRFSLSASASRGSAVVGVVASEVGGVVRVASGVGGVVRVASEVGGVARVASEVGGVSVREQTS